jgi:hypothetical protein
VNGQRGDRGDRGGGEQSSTSVEHASSRHRDCSSARFRIGEIRRDEPLGRAPRLHPVAGVAPEGGERIRKFAVGRATRERDERADGVARAGRGVERDTVIAVDAAR